MVYKPTMMEEAVKEWRDARQAVFDVPQSWWRHPNSMFPPGVLNRLSEAEDALFHLAKDIK